MNKEHVGPSPYPSPRSAGRGDLILPLLRLARFASSLVLCALVAPLPALAEADCLSFRDGDMLYGKLLEILPGSVLRWQHADASETIDFKPENVAQIDFSPRPVTAAGSNSSCKLWLANGDELAGNLVSCDRDFFILDTWYAGKLSIPRRALQTLAFNPRTPILFDGPTSMDGWTQGNAVKGVIGDSGQWSFRNGAFYADKAASIARDVKLPERSQIQFDLAWKGPLSMAVALYTDSLQPILLTDKENGPDFGGFYSLQFRNTLFVTLTPIRKKDPLRPLGEPLIIQSLTQKDRVHVDLRLSKADRQVALFLDGALIKNWIDPSGFAGQGTGLRFVNNSVGAAAVKMSNLRISKWNGVLDDVSAEVPDPSHDVVMLESGAKISGAVESMAEGRISMLTIGGATNVPLNSASAIEFAHFQGQAQAAAPAVNAHATFVQGGAVTFELLAWRPNGVEGTSPDFGKVKFDPAAFGRLQFLAVEPKKGEAPRE
jgi:hypothetical protein